MPLDYEINADDVGRWVDEFVATFDFTVPGEDGSLGRDMANKVAEEIANRSVDQGLDSNGEPFKALNREYREWKRKKYHVEEPGLRTGQMLSVTSLLGNTQVGPELVEMTYGTGTAPVASSTGYISDEDKAVTDTQKAEWFTESGRPFYELDETIAEEVKKVAVEALNKHMENG